MTSFYDPKTGDIHRSTYSGSDIEANTPDGYVAIEGDIDYRLYRVDTNSGNVIARDPEPAAPEILWSRVRSMRDRRLRDTDWIVARAIERGEQIPEGWIYYRQALRDITKQADPMNIQWPEVPK